MQKELPLLCWLKIITSKEKHFMIYNEESSLSLEHYKKVLRWIG